MTTLNTYKNKKLNYRYVIYSLDGYASNLLQLDNRLIILQGSENLTVSFL